MKGLTAILAAIILVSSSIMVLPQQQAHAQSLPAVQRLRIINYYTDGTNSGIGTSTTLTQLSITSPTNNKEISKIGVEVAILTPSTSDQVYSGSPSITLQVLARNAVFQDLSANMFNSLNTPKQLSAGLWQVYYAEIPASTISSKIGSGTSDFPSQIRVSTSTAYYTASISGVNTNYQATPLSLNADIVDKASGSVSDPGTNNGSTGSTNNLGGSTKQPTGTVFDRYIIYYQDGSSDVTGQLNTNTFSLIPYMKGASQAVSKIEYQLILHLDDPNTAVPATMTFANNAATDNFGAYSNNGQNVGKTYSNLITRLNGNNDYVVIDMTVDQSTLATLLKPNPPSGVAGITTYSGTLQFLVRPGTITLGYGSNQYPINVPQRSISLDLSSWTVDDSQNNGGQGGSSCEIVNGNSCQPRNFLTTGNNTYLILGAGVAAVGGIVILVKKKHK